MKAKDTFRAITIKPFMICGEMALPDEEVELTKTEYRELKYCGKIRDLTPEELQPGQQDQQDQQDQQPDKKDKK